MFLLFGNKRLRDLSVEPIDELRDLRPMPFELLSANKPSDNSIKLISDAHCC